LITHCYLQVVAALKLFDNYCPQNAILESNERHDFLISVERMLPVRKKTCTIICFFRMSSVFEKTSPVFLIFFNIIQNVRSPFVLIYRIGSRTNKFIIFALKYWIHQSSYSEQGNALKNVGFIINHFSWKWPVTVQQLKIIVKVLVYCSFHLKLFKDYANHDIDTKRWEVICTRFRLRHIIVSEPLEIWYLATKIPLIWTLTVKILSDKH
jgi:hypothetical protein